MTPDPIPPAPPPPTLISQTALASPLPAAIPSDLETQVAAALRWNYLVRLHYHRPAQHQLCSTVAFNLPSSDEEPRALTDPIRNRFRLSIHPDPAAGELIAQLIGQTSDGQNPQHWPGVTLEEQQTWAPDRSLARQSDSAPGEWLIEHTFPCTSESLFGYLTLEWTKLDFRAIQSAMFTAHTADTANPNVASPEVSFDRPIVPNIVREQIAPITLAATLASTLDALLTSLQPQSALKSSIEIAMSARFTAGGVPVSVPILLLPQSYNPSPEAISSQVAALRRQQDPQPPWTQLTVAIKLFPLIAPSTVAVQINEIPIDVLNVDENWWR